MCVGAQIVYVLVLPFFYYLRLISLLQGIPVEGGGDVCVLLGTHAQRLVLISHLSLLRDGQQAVMLS